MFFVSRWWSVFASKEVENTSIERVCRRRTGEESQSLKYADIDEGFGYTLDVLLPEVTLKLMMDLERITYDKVSDHLGL